MNPNTLWHIPVHYPGEEASPTCPGEFPPINPPYYSKQHLMKYGVEIAEEFDPQCSICHEDFQPMKDHWKIWRPALIELDDPRFTPWFRWGEWWDIGYKILYPHRPIKIKACGHVFGETCFRQYMEGDGVNKCPYCRTKLVDSETYWIYGIVQPVEQRRIELLTQLGQMEPYKDRDPEVVKRLNERYEKIQAELDEEFLDGVTFGEQIAVRALEILIAEVSKPTD